MKNFNDRFNEEIKDIKSFNLPIIQENKCLNELNKTKDSGYRTIFISKIDDLIILCTGSGKNVSVNQLGFINHEYFY